MRKFVLLLTMAAVAALVPVAPTVAAPPSGHAAHIVTSFDPVSPPSGSGWNRAGQFTGWFDMSVGTTDVSGTLDVAVHYPAGLRPFQFRFTFETAAQDSLVIEAVGHITSLTETGGSMSGTWAVLSGTGQFAGLQGVGKMSGTADFTTIHHDFVFDGILH